MLLRPEVPVTAWLAAERWKADWPPLPCVPPENGASSDPSLQSMQSPADCEGPRLERGGVGLIRVSFRNSRPRLARARVAEWQTQWTQNPPRATSCEFDSRLGHCAAVAI